MKIKIIYIIVLICFFYSCGRLEKKQEDYRTTNDDTKESILGMWTVNCNQNLVLYNLDTILISSFDNQIKLELKNNQEILIEGISFDKNILKFHISHNDTIRYYEFILSENNIEFVGGTTEGWDGREQNISLKKIK